MLPRPWVKAYVGLGANLGDPAAAVDAALHSLAVTAGIRGLRASGLYRSAPVEASGPWYLNAVAELETMLTAPALLQLLQTLEKAAGRERPYRNAPRTLDLDLLLYGEARIDSPLLTVPHPRMHERAFVLLPLAELAPARTPQPLLQAVQQQPIERLA
jgi:2-amino-4-hydroxy-6-hydroxymethyldihydropteridine diphosphokinase